MDNSLYLKFCSESDDSSSEDLNVKVVTDPVLVDPCENGPHRTLMSEDREFHFLRPENPLPRSSSLKANRNKPDSPRRNMSVRFADALGLDLESVRHILNPNEPPVVPNSAMCDLNLNLDTTGDRNRRSVTIMDEIPCLRSCFSNPIASADFRRRVLDQKVLLANCVMDNMRMTVCAVIHVANIAFEKRVTLRYTTNAWVTFKDIEAGFVSSSADGQTDSFQSIIDLRDYFVIGSRLEFSVRLICKGETYWDSNNGSNYRIECIASMPTNQNSFW